MDHMKDLIEALSILLKHQKADTRAPTLCEHDVLLVMGVPKELPPEDAKRLDALGFFWMGEYDCWGSFRFGSA
jgi:hypothetical protein